MDKSVQNVTHKQWTTKSTINKRSNQKQIERQGEIATMTFSYFTFIFYHGELSHCGKQNEGRI